MTEGTSFRVWAPNARSVELEAHGARHALDPIGSTGWWQTRLAGAGHATDYRFCLDGGEPRPDPRSAWQPHGVDGPSRVVDHARFAWSDAAWRGRHLHGGLVYELHIGTFTAEGTLDSAISRLDHLVDLGVTHVELLPMAAFPGERGWGYDGVALYAVHEAYGGPAALKRFVDAAHAHGLAILLDVVYNHLGPAGNHLREFGPYFTDRYATPWGKAINFDGPGSDEVRGFVIDNALGWLRDYHIDGLRLDAVHAIFDQSAVHILQEVAAAVHRLGSELGRTTLLIAESDLNDPRVIETPERGGYGLDAQWSDDLHHALHVTLTGERGGYYADFDGLGDVATAMRNAYVIAGRYSRHRGRRHGRSPTGLPATRFLGYLQNHDQVGNRAAGERIGQLVSPGLARIGAALVLTSPFTPLLFMGEEWSASTPWQYFTDHADPALARAVQIGRRREFEVIGEAAHVPDPQDRATFERSRLDWTERSREPHRSMLDWYRRLIGLRRQYSDLADPDLALVEATCSETDRWLTVRRRALLVVANLALRPQRVPLPVRIGEIVLASEAGWSSDLEGLHLPAESIVVARVAVPSGA